MCVIFVVIDHLSRPAAKGVSASSLIIRYVKVRQLLHSMVQCSIMADSIFTTHRCGPEGEQASAVLHSTNRLEFFLK